MKKWDDENTASLIKMYEQYDPDLWKINDKKLKNPELKKNLWALIAEVHETSVDEVQLKIKRLRSKFAFELKQYEQMPDSYFENNPWKFFRNFMFLLEEAKLRGSSAVSESCMSDTNCSSKQFGTEYSSGPLSRHQDESQDFESSNIFDTTRLDEEDEILENKNEYSDQDLALENALQSIKTLLDERNKRDEHSIYGEHIAHKLRTCNRSNLDIAIAQHHIENIVFNLSIGAYQQETQDGLRDKSNIATMPNIIRSVPDPIIVKSDPSP